MSETEKPNSPEFVNTLKVIDITPKSSNWVKDYLLPCFNTLSILVGIVIAVTQLAAIRENSDNALKSLRLQSLSYVDAFVDQYYDVQQHRLAFNDIFTEEFQQEFMATVPEQRNGQNFYHGNDLEDYKAVVSYWERLAALIRTDYLDFEIIYESIPFPNAFWEDTTTMRLTLKENWYGEREPLNGFLKNMSWLHDRYQDADELNLTE